MSPMRRVSLSQGQSPEVLTADRWPYSVLFQPSQSGCNEILWSERFSGQNFLKSCTASSPPIDHLKPIG